VSNLRAPKETSACKVGRACTELKCSLVGGGARRAAAYLSSTPKEVELTEQNTLSAPFRNGAAQVSYGSDRTELTGEVTNSNWDNSPPPWIEARADQTLQAFEAAVVAYQSAVEYLNSFDHSGSENILNMQDLDPNETFNGYAPIRCIGGGSSGKTWLVRHLMSGQNCAMKVSAHRMRHGHGNTRNLAIQSALLRVAVQQLPACVLLVCLWFTTCPAAHHCWHVANWRAAWPARLHST
jgi:hypothetical protein